MFERVGWKRQALHAGWSGRGRAAAVAVAIAVVLVALGGSAHRAAAVDLIPTSLSVSVPVSAVARGPAQSITATLTIEGTGDPVVGQIVTLDAGSEATPRTCSALTDAQGQVSCQVTWGSPSVNTVTASFAGTAGLQASTDTGRVVVDFAQTALQSSSASPSPATTTVPVTLSTTFTRTSAPTGPIAGAVVTFTLRNPSDVALTSCTDTTDATGLASCSVTPSGAAVGASTVTISASGTSVLAAPTTVHLPLQVKAIGVAALAASAFNGAVGVQQTITATLTDEFLGTPLVGKQVTFTLPGGDTCGSSAVTDANGNATCTVTPGAAIDDRYTVSYDGQAGVFLPASGGATYHVGVPDLTITKTHTGNFTQGQSGQWTITVTNSGSAPTSDTIAVTDTLPAGFTLSSTVTGAFWDCASSTETVVQCTSSSALDAGASASAISLNVDVLSNAQSVTNTATVSGGGETNTANDSASDPTTVIEPTPPDTTITAHPSDPNNSVSQSFSFSGDDGAGGSGVASFECKHDSGSFTACTSPQSYSPSDGSHTFQVRAIDAVGNVDPSPAQFTWTVDFLPPQAFIDAHPSDPSNNASAQFHYSGLDNHTPDNQLSFECKLDDSAFAACPLGSIFYSGLLDGSHTFQVRATDAAGNVQQFPTTFTWTVDTTPPTDTPGVSGTLGNNGWYTTSVSVAWHWTDGGGGSGIDTSHCTQTSTSTGAGSSVTVSSSCKDLAGNSSSDSRLFKIDTTNPQLTPTLSTSTIALNQTGVTASPGATDTGGSGVASSSCGAISTSSVGDHTVTCTATDNAGNSNSSTIHYTVGYRFGGFSSPLPKSTINAGSALPVKFQLLNAAGQPISDTEAQSLVSGSCKIMIILVKGGPVVGCPMYSSSLKQFQFNLKTTDQMKGANGVSITITTNGAVVLTSPVVAFTVK